MQWRDYRAIFVTQLLTREIVCIILLVLPVIALKRTLITTDMSDLINVIS